MIGIHRRPVRLAPPTRHPLLAADAADIALFVETETIGRATDRFIRHDPRAASGDLQGLMSIRVNLKQDLWAFAAFVLEATLLGKDNRDNLDHLRAEIWAGRRCLRSAIEDMTGVGVDELLVEGDRADASCVFAMIGRIFNRVAVKVPVPGRSPVLAWERIEMGRRYLADLDDAFVWLDRMVFANDALYELEWQAATWYFERRMCYPTTANEGEAVFERIKEWFYLDRPLVGTGAEPVAKVLAMAEAEARRAGMDWELGAIGDAGVRSASSTPGVFYVQEADAWGLRLEHLQTGEIHDVDERALSRGTQPGDYVFGRTFGRVVPLAVQRGAARMDARKDLSRGSVVVTLDDRAASAVRSWVERAASTLGGAFVIEGALRVARGEEPALRDMPPVEMPGNARALLARWAPTIGPRHADAAMAEWREALQCLAA